MTLIPVSKPSEIMRHACPYSGVTSIWYQDRETAKTLLNSIPSHLHVSPTIKDPIAEGSFDPQWRINFIDSLKIIDYRRICRATCGIFGSTPLDDTDTGAFAIQTMGHLIDLGETISWRVFADRIEGHSKSKKAKELVKWIRSFDHEFLRG